MTRLPTQRPGFGQSIRLPHVVAAAALIGLLVQPAQSRGKQSDKPAQWMESVSGGDIEFGPVFDPSNYNPILLPDARAAVPYPSIAAYTWCQGTIIDVDLNIYGITHGNGGDVDMVLQGPGGQSTKIISDASDGAIDRFYLTFDDEAATEVPETIKNDTAYRPTNVDQFDGMRAPSPEPTMASLSVFDGTSPAGDWKLFIQDDNLGLSGNIEFGWDLTLTVTSQVAGRRICIPHVGNGEAYPSAQTVSGRTAPVQDVNVALNGLTHTAPDDLDVLLQGPGGQNVILMSDAGGLGDANNLNLTIDEDASAGLPDETLLASGSFKPTNVEPEVMPAPAPAGPHGTALSVFHGTNPNGTWQLFLTDDHYGDQGILSSWSLQITTPQATVAVKGKKVREGKLVLFTLTRTRNLDVSETVSYVTKNGSARKGKDYQSKSGTVTFAPGESIKKVKVSTKNDSRNEQTEKFFLKVKAGAVTSQGSARIKDND